MLVDELNCKIRDFDTLLRCWGNDKIKNIFNWLWLCVRFVDRPLWLGYIEACLLTGPLGWDQVRHIEVYISWPPDYNHCKVAVVSRPQDRGARALLASLILPTPAPTNILPAFSALFHFYNLSLVSTLTSCNQPVRGASSWWRLPRPPCPDLMDEG